jgi:hypothetical protein
MECSVTKAMNAGPRSVAGMMEGQAPIAVVGLVAIAVIVAVHLFSRPPLATAGRAANGIACRECGTVIAVRRSAHSVPVTFVEVQMSDGSVRTLRAPTRHFSVGDPVEVRDDALELRNPS